MAELYTYLIDFGDGEDFVPVSLIENKIVYVHKLHDTFHSIEEKQWEGSFVLAGENFDKYTNAVISGDLVNLSIYDVENAKYYNITLKEIGEFDYNQRVVTVNMPKWQYPANSIMNNLKTKSVLGTSSDKIYNAAGSKLVTNYSHKISSIVYGIMSGLQEAFYIADAWYDSYYPYPPYNTDLGIIRIFSMRYLIPDGVSGELGGNNYSITLEKIFKLLIDVFQIFPWIDWPEFQLKFKRIEDLVTNVLDVTGYTTHLNQKKFNTDKFFNLETLQFSINNEQDSDVDWINHFIQYDRGSGNNEIDHSDVTTYWKLNGDYNSDGIFLALVDPATNYMIGKLGYVSGSFKENGHMATSQILNDWYRDHIFTNRDDATISAAYGIDKPTHFQNFIEYPEIEVKIADMSVFHNGLKWLDESGNTIICRTLRQETSLATGMTKFLSYEFSNEIN